MRESISYTVTLNFVITFIIIVFALLSATLIYFKNNKVGNIIVNSIEKYEGYNALSEQEIYDNLLDIGYDMNPISCSPNVKTSWAIGSEDCYLVSEADLESSGSRGYCIYLCSEDNDYYYYRVKTNMLITVPVVSNVLPVPIFSNTNRLYDFEKNMN